MVWGGRLAGGAAIVLALGGDALAQCAMCRTALESSAEGQLAAASFNHGILFLLAAPFLIVALIAVAMFRARRPSQQM